MLIFEISLPSTPTFGGKMHWLLAIEDNTDYAWSNVFENKVQIEKCDDVEHDFVC